MTDSTQPEKMSEELFNTEDLMEQDDNVTEAGESEIILSKDTGNIESLSENNQTEGTLNEKQLTENVAEDAEEKDPGTEKKSVKISSDRVSLTQLPLSKVKHIIKLDPEVNLVNGEAVFLITKATELFIQNLAKEANGYATANKKKTILKSHIDQALASLPVEL